MHIEWRRYGIERETICGRTDTPLLIFTYSFPCLELTAVGNNNSLAGLAGLGADGLNSLDDVQALSDLTEHDVLAVEPGAWDSADEELRSVGVGSGVSHGQDTSASVLVDEVLISELSAVD